jgi:hypothetical protein
VDDVGVRVNIGAVFADMRGRLWLVNRGMHFVIVWHFEGVIIVLFVAGKWFCR